MHNSMPILHIHCTIIILRVVLDRGKYTMSSKKGVPCPCPFCKGKIVSVYVRHQHVTKFCSIESRSGVTCTETHSDSDSPVSELCVSEDPELSPDSPSPELVPSSPMSTPASSPPSSPLELSLLSTSALAFSPPFSPQSMPPSPLSADPMSVSASASESSTPDKDGFVQHFDPTLYDKSEAASPLYEGSNVTVLEAVAHYMVWFTNHPGTSKDALSSILSMQHHNILPKPNHLPDSYSAAMKVIEPFLIKPLEFDVCPNDCVIFRGAYATLTECPICNSKRYKKNNSPYRRFQYLPIGPRLERIFGTANLAKLVQAHGHSSGTSEQVLSDIHSSLTWKAAYSEEGVFRGDNRGIAFGICADGVNPFSHLRTTYSMCPIVLSLLNLPRNIRYNFGNLFLVGIIPGNGRQEAKTIQPYLEVLVDELISLSNAELYDAYQQSTFQLKVKILIHILDYPGIAKMFNINGAGAYKGCAWCDIRGTYNKPLSKMVYLESRRFLPLTSSLRSDKTNFPCKSKENRPKPSPRTFAEVKSNHEAYDNAESKHQANVIAQATGCKGKYALMDLDNHNPITQTVPDAMHTVKVVVEHLFMLIVGKEDSVKVRQAEIELSRFGLKSSTPTAPARKQRKNELAVAPFRITKEQVKLADERACTIICPVHIDFIPRAFFSKTNFKSHDWKQIAAQGILKYCLRGFLDKQQRDTLFFFLDVLARVLQETHDMEDLDNLEQDMNTALALIERDFPVSTQVICMHLLHHVVPGIRQFGPVYGTWMFSFERFNSWMCRRAMNRAFPEATVIQTYRIFEWCSYMVASGKVPKETSDSEDEIICGMSSEGVLHPEKVNELQKEYKSAIPSYAKLLDEYEKASERAGISRVKSLFPGKSAWNPPGRVLSDSERQLLIGPVGIVDYFNKITVCDRITKRRIEYSCMNMPLSQSNMPKQSSSFVSISIPSQLRTHDKPIFGVIVTIFSHSFAQSKYFWAVVEQFTTARYDSELKMWYVSITATHSSLVMLDHLSYPLIVAIDESQLWFLNAQQHV